MDMPNKSEFEKSTGASDHTRVSARESMFLGVTVLFDGEDKAVQARVRNLSSGGMLIDTKIAKLEGLGLTAVLKNVGNVRGRVAWSTSERVGIAFDLEIDPQKARQKPDSSIAQPTFKAPYSEGRRPGLTIR